MRLSELNTLPWKAEEEEDKSRVEVFIILPLFKLHSLRNVNLNGVPGNSFPLPRVICKPKVNFAIWGPVDDRFEHGSITLNSAKIKSFFKNSYNVVNETRHIRLGSCGILPLGLIDITGGNNTFSSNDTIWSKL